MQVNEDKGYQQLMGLKMKAPSALVYIGGGEGSQYVWVTHALMLLP